MKLTTKKMVVMAMMIAISVILSYPMFKINGSIGFDALPGFLSAVILGPVLGGIVGLIGHLASAILTGFQLGPTNHMIIAVFMFFACGAFGWLREKLGRYVAAIVAFLLNAPVTLAIVALIMSGGTMEGFVGVFVAFIGVLSAAAAISIVLAEVIYTTAGKYLVVD